jgi:hypothetical protein
LVPGSPKIPVEAATKDKKRGRDLYWPQWKRADPIRANAAVANRHNFQNARQTNY